MLLVVYNIYNIAAYYLMMHYMLEYIFLSLKIDIQESILNTNALLDKALKEKDYYMSKVLNNLRYSRLIKFQTKLISNKYSVLQYHFVSMLK